MTKLRKEQIPPQTPAFRNLLINGDMRINQRGVNDNGLSSGYAYRKGPDRWKHAAMTAGTHTAGQGTSVPTGKGFTNNYYISVTTAQSSLDSGAYLFVEQNIEGQFLQRIKKGTASAEPLTISFWVRSSKAGGTHIVELYDADNIRHVNAAYTVNAVDTWEYKEITFPPDTTGAFVNDVNQSLRVVFWVAAGSNFSSGSLASAWAGPSNPNRAAGQANLADAVGNVWAITGVQLEAGDTATDFEHIPLDIQLQRCQRYGYSPGCLTGIWASGSQIRLLEALPVYMRAIPTATLLTSTPRAEKWQYSAHFGVGSTVEYNYSTQKNLELLINGFSTSNVLGDIAYFNADQLWLDAEL